jgi:hypothetical protein
MNICEKTRGRSFDNLNRIIIREKVEHKRLCLLTTDYAEDILPFEEQIIEIRIYSDGINITLKDKEDYRPFLYSLVKKYGKFSKRMLTGYSSDSDKMVAGFEFVCKDVAIPLVVKIMSPKSCRLEYEDIFIPAATEKRVKLVCKEEK